ncbi:protein similar isoform X2 [Ochlerotatus camptorhynchus]|uniref:protein similar isoform X2 n=1 Tax=Ochlerotatus camptorhynchus TaxID=644619 RepID=UPI0031D324A8
MTRATTVKPKPEKEKRRNNEKRKEKSRDAARCRRSRETEIFQDLASLLPMRQEDVDHLDKASVMRLSIAYLKVRDMLELFPTINKLNKQHGSAVDGEDDAMHADESDGEEDSKAALNELALEKEKLALLSLDGFLLALSADGDITFVSENVLEYLGISQIDMMGQPIWDYSHQCDHEELREALNGRNHSPSELLKGVANSECKPLENRDFFLRLKCTLTSRGRSVNIKSASYKVIHVTGHIACKENGQRQLVAVARPMPHPSNIEVPLDSSTFLSKHSLDMKFSYVDDKMHALLGYNPADLMGKPLYECHHGIDSDHLMGTFKNVMSKGQSETARYRFLARTGGYAWVVTQATLIYDKQKPHSIVCVNYVISGVENKDEIYSCAQLEARQQKPTIADSVPSVAPEEAVNKSSAATAAVTVKTSDRVLKENINYNNNNNDPRQKSAEEEEDGEEAASQVIKVIRKVPAPISANCGNSSSITAGGVIRPVSVTASIFSSSVAKNPIVTTAATSATTSTTVAGTSVGIGEEKPPERKVPQSVTAKLFKPKHATEKIFAPRTEDMNKGFLMFSDEESGLTMLKDEPDDLTHLAPTAGDACIPLEETGPFFNDVFDDFMIPDNYTSLLQDDLSSLDSTDHQLRSSSSISVASPITINDSVTTAMSQHHHSPNSSSNCSNNSASSSSSSSSSTSSAAASSSSTTSSSSASTLPSLASVTSGIGSAISSIVSQNGSGQGGQNGQTVVVGSGASNDPFINYRDEITEISHSPQHLLSPALSKSPEGSSIPSLCSPNGSGCPEDELAFMTLNMDDDDLDLSMRAPYISMSEVDDLPLLTSDDLMWGAPAASVDSATAAAMAAAAGKYLIKEEYVPPTQQQLSSSQGHSATTNTTSCSSPSVGMKSSPVTVSTRIADFNSNTSNNHNNENNCNIGNKIIDSSLAALLCGGNVINIQTSTIQLQQHQQQSQNGNRHILVQQQQQQQQQQPQVISAQSEGDKRFNLLHPMVVITPNYKNSNSIEAWTMNDLLQLNGASTSGTTTATTGGSKLNVIASIVSKKNSTASPTVSTNSTSYKRPLAESGDGCSKRVKPNPTQSSHRQQQQSPTSSPQLLQQLMAPSPVPAKAKAKSKSMLDQADQHRWPTGKVNGLQEQASNSVLMNLLVSGCDANIPDFPSEGLIAEDGLMHDHNELTDDEDEDRIPILANPMLGSTTSTAPTGQLTIQTDDICTPTLHRGGNVDDDDFMMTVSPSLLTPSDLEIWRAIKQGLDPKKIPQNYGLSLAAGYGDRIPKSLATTPTAQLGMMHDDPHGETGVNLLSVLDPAMAISGLRTDEDDDEYDGATQHQQQQDYEMTIPVNEILQNNLI